MSKKYNKNIKKQPKTYNLSILTKKYEDKWVALSTDYKEILAVGNSLDSVLKKTKRPDKVVLKVIPQLGYAPHIL